MAHEKRNQLTVPILLPMGRDAELVGRILDQAQITVVVCTSMQELLAKVLLGCGPLIIGEEALSDDSANQLMKALNTQPEWSELPAIILTRRYGGNKSLDLLAKRQEVSVVERPVKKNILINIVKNAIAARKRQYQIRELLEELVRANEKLRSRTELLQKLTLELTKAEDQERQRISQILHDDLQQILASAKLQADVLSENLKGEAAQKAKMLHHTVSEAMKTSRSLSHELNPEFIHGNNFREALKKIGERMAENYKFQLRTSIEIDANRISKDIKLFTYRSLQELFFNCTKHARASRVSLAINGQSNYFTCMLADNGVGFEPEKMKLQGGSKGGFGLFSIQERALAFGGVFEVSSVIGRGSRFVLKLPFDSKDVVDNTSSDGKAQYAVVMADKTSEIYENSDVITVMIVDDHSIMRQSLSHMLRNQPGIMVVAEAEDGKQAVEYALQVRPEVILMDFSMPHLNGADATRKIKDEAPGIAVIGLTMHGDSSTKKNMLQAGAHTFLTKEVQAQDLIAAIKLCAKRPDVASQK